jgi:hypothetical protein
LPRVRLQIQCWMQSGGFIMCRMKEHS